MKGDFSRFTFRRAQHYNSVRMQQGRVQTDADWNEEVEILAHLRRTQGVDVIGGNGAPRLGGGFLIGADGANLSIAPGRMYVDGILVENEALVWYQAGAGKTAQPHYPLPAGAPAPVNGRYIVYLDVWERHVTWLEDGAIREVALGGPDTATRAQTIWQVRLLAADALNCWDNPSAWQELVGAAKGRMSARAKPVEAATGPCVIPASAGFRGLENQLYRVEIHRRGPAGTATFKWSRDNGMVATRLTEVNARVLTVADAGRDAVLGFAPGQWIEVSDDARVLRGEPGVLVRIRNVVENTIEIESWLGTPPALDLATATVRRWDHSGDDPALDVPAPAATWTDLEDGVQVRFHGGGNSYETGDYWLIPARTVSAATLGGEIEWPRDPAAPAQPQALPPRGIEHHFARLAIVNWDGTAYQVEHDCRPLFPALIEPDLFYVSGDGQETMPGERLPQPLRVGVSNCNRPVEGAWVKFEIEEGGGTLEVDPVPTDFERLSGTATAMKAFIARTDENGEVAAFWRLEELVGVVEDKPSQLVRATLLRSDANAPAAPEDVPENYLDAPVLFGASFGVAWENQYGGSDFPDQQHASLAVVTIEQALDQLRENTALHYVSGTGQQAPRGAARLPEPLIVRVANGQWPLNKAKVRFIVRQNGTLLEHPGGTPVTGDFVDVVTDEHGLAYVYWKLSDGHPSQQVLAVLVDPMQLEADPADPLAEGAPSPGIVLFTAQLNLASEITYDGSAFPDAQHPSLRVPTVEAALDQLRENTALHYAGGDGQEVYPGETLPQPLRVRVANGQWPRQLAAVRFVASHGTLQSGITVGIELPQVATDRDGIAECTWIPAAAGPVSQTVTATLVSPTQLPAGTGVVIFNAILRRADKTFYVAHAESTPGTDNAQRALDDLYAKKVNRAGDTITGDLVIQGNLTVNGSQVIANTETMEVEDNIIRVNKYAPQPTPQPLNAGLEVFRGGTAPNAQLLWDETLDQWKIGLDGSLFDVAYGPNWITLTTGGVADALHRHRRLYASQTAPLPALSVDTLGRIGIGTETPQTQLHVMGGLRLAVGEGLEFLGDQSYFGSNQDARVFRMIDANGSDGVVDGGIAVEGFTPGDGVRRPILAIRGAGHVGIGTKTPDARLHVVAPPPETAYYLWTGPATAGASHSGASGNAEIVPLVAKVAAEDTFAPLRNATRLIITNAGGAGIARISGSGPLASVMLEAQDANSGAWVLLRSWLLQNTSTGGQGTRVFHGEDISFAKRDISGLRFQAVLALGTSVTLRDWNGMRFEFHSDHDVAIFEGRIGGTLHAGGNVQVDGAAHVNGSLTSNMWRVTQVFDNAAGGLPRPGSFTSGGGTLLVFASGTGFSPTPGRQIGMEIVIDNVAKGKAMSFTNEAGSHKAFSANALVVSAIGAGTHTLELRELTPTETDANDFFSVTVLELPWVTSVAGGIGGIVFDPGTVFNPGVVLNPGVVFNPGTVVNPP